MANLAGSGSGATQLQSWARRLDNSPQAAVQRKTAALMQAPAVANNAPVQRKIEQFETRDEDDPAVAAWQGVVATFVTMLDTLVTQARALSCNWRALAPDGGYVSQWVNTAQTFFQNPQQAPPFIYARFGYAVETLACAQLPATAGNLNVHQQYASGATRPDVVLKNGNEEIAWIDITANASYGHIRGKDGGGWSSRPFVYEVLYDSLALSEILGGRNAPVLEEVGAYMGSRAQISAEEQEAQRLRAGAVLIALREEQQWVTGIGDSALKRQQTRERVEAELNINLGAWWTQNLKGLLSWAEVSDGPFGFNTYYGGQDAAAARHWGATAAAPDVAHRQGELDEEKREDIRDVLDSDDAYDDLPFVVDFHHHLQAAGTERIAIGLAVMTAAPYMPELRQAAQDLGQHTNGFDNLAELKEEVDQMIIEIPQHADINDLNTWVNEAIPLLRLTRPMINAQVALRQVNAIADHFADNSDARAMTLMQRINDLEQFPGNRDIYALETWADETDGMYDEAVLLRDTLQAQQQFNAYLREKYRTDLHIFARTPQENNLLLRLAQVPVDNQAIIDAGQYTNQHPLG